MAVIGQAVDGGIQVVLSHPILGNPLVEHFQGGSLFPAQGDGLVLHQGTHQAGKDFRTHALQTLHPRCTNTFVFVVEYPQIHLGDVADGEVAVHLCQEAHLQPPVTGNTQVQGKIRGKGKFSGEGVAEGVQVAQQGLGTHQLLQGIQNGHHKQPGGAPMHAVLLQGEPAVEGFHVRHAELPFQQRAQHPHGIRGVERANVRIKQGNEFGFQGGGRQAHPDGPTLTSRTQHVQARIMGVGHKVPQYRPIGPKHLDRAGHLLEKGLRLIHFVLVLCSQGNDQVAQVGKAGQHIPGQRQSRTTQLVKEARNQDTGPTLSQLLVEALLLMGINGAVIVNSANGVLKKIHRNPCEWASALAA